MPWSGRAREGGEMLIGGSVGNIVENKPHACLCFRQHGAADSEARRLMYCRSDARVRDNGSCCRSAGDRAFGLWHQVRMEKRPADDRPCSARTTRSACGSERLRSVRRLAIGRSRRRQRIRLWFLAWVVNTSTPAVTTASNQPNPNPALVACRWTMQATKISVRLRPLGSALGGNEASGELARSCLMHQSARHAQTRIADHGGEGAAGRRGHVSPGSPGRIAARWPAR